MIQTFKHKGLERYFKASDKRGLPTQCLARLERILDVLDAATVPSDMALPGFKFHAELALGDKADLAEIGRAKQSAAGGDKVSEQAATAFVKNDNTAPKHNTRTEIAKSAGVSTGKVAQAEIVRREAPDLWEKAKAQKITIGAAYTQIDPYELG